MCIIEAEMTMTKLFFNGKIVPVTFQAQGVPVGLLRDSRDFSYSKTKTDEACVPSLRENRLQNWKGLRCRYEQRNEVGHNFLLSLPFGCSYSFYLPPVLYCSCFRRRCQVALNPLVGLFVVLFRWLVGGGDRGGSPCWHVRAHL